VCCSLGLALALGRALVILWFLFGFVVVRFILIGFVFVRLVLFGLVFVRLVFIRFIFVRLILIRFILIRSILLPAATSTPIATNMALEKVTKKTKTTSTLGLQNIADRPLAAQIQTPLERWQYVPAAISA
jgi:hypothetical protein